MSEQLKAVYEEARVAYLGRGRALTQGAPAPMYRTVAAMTVAGLPALLAGVRTRMLAVLPNKDLIETARTYEECATMLAMSRDHMLADATPIQQAAAHGKHLATGLADAKGVEGHADGFLKAAIEKVGAP